jgi:phosphate starvation-inducible PhoH-like protein
MAKTTRRNSVKKSTRKIALNAEGSLTKFFIGMDDSTSMELERLLGQHGISARLNGVSMLILKCPGDDSQRISENLSKLNNDSSPITLDLIKQTIEAPQELSEQEASENWTSITLRHARPGMFTTIKPKTQHQQDAINEIINKKVTLLMGSAGTGKSMLGLCVGLRLLELKKIQKVIITKPPIDAGPGIGYLPGTEQEKLLPYTLSVMSLLTELVGSEKRDKLFKDGSIEIQNLGYLRGMTLGSSKRSGVLFLVDECQNLNFHENKMVLSRIGDHPETRIVYAGDQLQSDLEYKRDTLSLIHSIIKDSPFVGSVVFDRSDIVRSATVRDLMERIETWEDAQNLKKMK